MQNITNLCNLRAKLVNKIGLVDNKNKIKIRPVLMSQHTLHDFSF